jgi:ATP-binding cassette subfamily C protein LapB
MLMDEPSNAMDQTTESRLLNNFKENLEGITSLIVTQKMSLLKIVDRIIVLHEGRVIIDAPKEEALLKLNDGKKK